MTGSIDDHLSIDCFLTLKDITAASRSIRGQPVWRVPVEIGEEDAAILAFAHRPILADKITQPLDTDRHGAA